MDRQARKFREELDNAEVERIGEGIKITFASSLLFDVDSSTLRDPTKEKLEELAGVLQKYEDTKILFYRPYRQYRSGGLQPEPARVDCHLCQW